MCITYLLAIGSGEIFGNLSGPTTSPPPTNTYLGLFAERLGQNPGASGQKPFGNLGRRQVCVQTDARHFVFWPAGARIGRFPLLCVTRQRTLATHAKMMGTSWGNGRRSETLRFHVRSALYKHIAAAAAIHPINVVVKSLSAVLKETCGFFFALLTRKERYKSGGEKNK